MRTVEFKFTLTEVAVAKLLEGITSKSEILVARHPDAIYATLKLRRAALGGMLELARRLDAPRVLCPVGLVHAREPGSVVPGTASTDWSFRDLARANNLCRTCNLPDHRGFLSPPRNLTR
jgi:hypothetical protein